jgi:hypothetical protein
MLVQGCKKKKMKKINSQVWLEEEVLELSFVSSRHQQDEQRRNVVQVQDVLSRRGHMVEACHTYGVPG